MPYFAYVQNDIVQKVERIEHEPMCDDLGIEQESMGQKFLVSCYPNTVATDYVLTFYTENDPSLDHPRGKYAGIGDMWDGDKFAAPAAPEPVELEETPAP